jgi:signal peptidase I
MTSNVVKEFFHILFYIVLVLFTAYLINHFIIQRTKVIGVSMETTLYEDDSLLVDRLSYRFRKPKRFDIIVFPMDENNVYYIKRIIGMPGETVQIRDGNIYINNELLKENFGKESINIGYEGVALEPIVVGEDEYFVLGDNRNHSTDSRDETVGNIPRDIIIGKAWLRLWPTKQIGILDK